MRILPVVLILSSVCALVRPEESSFMAEVISVPAGDILKIEHNGDQELVVLHGVKCRATTTSSGVKARAFTSDCVKGNAIQVQVVEKKHGLTYVAVHLDDGSSLNEVLLSKGLAEWDRLSAPGDASYEDVESRAREKGIGVWWRPGTPRQEAVAANEKRHQSEEKYLDADQEIRRYNQHRTLTRIAQFETEYRHWRQLSEGQRQSIRSYSNSLLNDNLLVGQQRIVGRTQLLNREIQRQQQNSADQASQRWNITLENWTEGAHLATIWDDFDLQWDAGMMQGFTTDMNANIAIGDYYMAGIDRSLSDKYVAKTAMNLQRVGSQASRMSAFHESNRRGYRRALAALNEEAISIEGDRKEALGKLRAVATVQTNQYKRNTAQLSRLAALDRALEAEYVPFLRTTVVESWADTKSQESILFDVKTDIWIVDWDTGQNRGKGNLRASIHSFPDMRIVNQFKNTRDPHASFIVLQGPGKYYLDISVRDEMPYRVDVVEIDWPIGFDPNAEETSSYLATGEQSRKPMVAQELRERATDIGQDATYNGVTLHVYSAQQWSDTGILQTKPSG